MRAFKIDSTRPRCGPPSASLTLRPSVQDALVPILPRAFMASYPVPNEPCVPWPWPLSGASASGTVGVSEPARVSRPWGHPWRQT